MKYCVWCCCIIGFGFFISTVAWQVKKAFFALVANGVRAAPLWDTEKQSFVGKNPKTSHKTDFMAFILSPHSKIIVFVAYIQKYNFH